MKVQRLKVNHIDLIEVAPLRASLKLYGGRLHAPRIQDLPFAPGTELTEDQIAITRYYNINDLVETAFIYQGLQDQIRLREVLSQDYGIDLRSKSDPQVAEAIMRSEVSAMMRGYIRAPQIQGGMIVPYSIPAFINYETPLLNWMLDTMRHATFITDEGGVLTIPPNLSNLELNIGKSTYKMGIGGLHSQETRRTTYATPEHSLVDIDVASYYPKLIVNSGMYPPQLGLYFQRVYLRLLHRRLEAKLAKNKPISESLKIALNGVFGKMGSPYSILYAPEMLIYVTLTGQLSLMMLIERLELQGFEIVSANTDGMTSKVPTGKEELFNAIIKQWELETNLEMEQVQYRALHSRDVNNYIAVKMDGKVKSKGVYMNAWKDKDLAIFRFHKNPVNLVCTEAVERYLVEGVLPHLTVLGCSDPRQFISVRTVKGGAVKNGDYLGKAIRWYYAAGETGDIIYANSGKMVARSTGARPLMDLPNELPSDLDLDWYIHEACSMIRDLGLADPYPHRRI